MLFLMLFLIVFCCLNLCISKNIECQCFIQTKYFNLEGHSFPNIMWVVIKLLNLSLLIFQLETQLICHCCNYENMKILWDKSITNYQICSHFFIWKIEQRILSFRYILILAKSKNERNFSTNFPTNITFIL